MSQALFGRHTGTEDELRELQHEAAHFIAARIHLARGVLFTAAAQLIIDLDLLNLQALRPEDMAKRNPIVQLKTYADKQHVRPQITYALAPEGTEHECTIKLEINGTSYVQKGLGRNKKEAKREASKNMLAQLPCD